MTDETLFHATVPVMRHYVGRSLHLLKLVPPTDSQILDQRLSDDGFTCGEHLAISQRFSLRGVFPVMGQPVPDLEEPHWDRTTLQERGATVLAHLDGLAAVDFEGAGTLPITHTAGQTQVTQNGHDYLTLYILPNQLFHLTTAYAILRTNGIAVGKGDFDGFHAYAPGFRF